MGRKFEAFWVFEEEVPKQENNKTLRDKPFSSYKYEGIVVISDRGINLKGKSIATSENFKTFILFSKILRMEKIPPKILEGDNKKKVPEQALRIVYQEQGKNRCVYLQEKLVEIEEGEEGI
ncbi:MAG: hypothetical protein QW279_13305 [Candidatus Jordarchaeaceae archaeon]